MLALNPFFVLEYVPPYPPQHPVLTATKCRNDPTPDRGAQLPRAAALITSSRGFVHDLRTGQLSPDKMRGRPLDMDQYQRLFGTARVPTGASRSRTGWNVCEW